MHAFVQPRGPVGQARGGWVTRGSQVHRHTLTRLASGTACAPPHTRTLPTWASIQYSDMASNTARKNGLEEAAATKQCRQHAGYWQRCYNTLIKQLTLCKTAQQWAHTSSHKIELVLKTTPAHTKQRWCWKKITMPRPCRLIWNGSTAGPEKCAAW